MPISRWPASSNVMPGFAACPSWMTTIGHPVRYVPRMPVDDPHRIIRPVFGRVGGT
jgi:hypothetical protein